MLKYYTFRSRDEIEELAQAVEEEPFLRAAQRALADDVTTLTHGEDETERVKAAAAALFGGGELSSARRRDADAALSEAPHVEIPTPASCRCYVDLFAETGTRRAARARPGARWARAVRTSTTSGSPTRMLAPTPQTLLPGGWLLLRRASATSPASRSAPPEP